MKFGVFSSRCGNTAEIYNYSTNSLFGGLREDILVELHRMGVVNVYFTYNGKICNDFTRIESGAPIIAVSRLQGGKGGFGSMLRAIGAQIEKTTNRDACRDLSGRRLRDINEEQRLKRWFAKQGERELEKVEAKKRKLEKLKQVTEGPPLPIIDDQQYNKQRAEMADSVFAAVDYGIHIKNISVELTVDTGFEAAGTSTSSKVHPVAAPDIPSTSSSSESEETITVPSKRPNIEIEVAKSKPKKMKKLMMDDDLDSASSDSDEEVTRAKAVA